MRTSLEMLFSRGCTNPNWFFERRLTMHPPRKGSKYFFLFLLWQPVHRLHLIWDQSLRCFHQTSQLSEMRYKFSFKYSHRDRIRFKASAHKMQQIQRSGQCSDTTVFTAFYGRTAPEKIVFYETYINKFALRPLQFHG